MARIRSIKPEFPQSETIGKLSRDARLLFIQLWTVVDDEGRTRAASRMLASLLYPYDDDARDLMDGWLEELQDENCIRVYTVDGSTYLEIVNWLKHQKIDHAGKSKIPEFREEFAKPREASRSLAPDLGPSILDLGPRTEDHSCAVAVATRPNRSEVFEEFWKAYPKRQGANPRKPALQAFETAVKQGADPAAIVDGAKRCAAADRDKIGTPYIPQAVKWLRDRRWEDYKPPPVESRVFQPPPGAPSDSELREKYEREAAASNHGNAEPTGDNPEELCSESPPAREAIGRNGVSDDHPRKPGMRGLGEILRPISPGPSVGLSGIDRGDH